MKETQPPSPEPEQESEELKPVESYPPEHIASIIERSQLAPVAGSLLAHETAEEVPNFEKQVENRPVELDYELSHEAKDQAIAGSQPKKNDMNDKERYIAPKDKVTLSRVRKSFTSSDLSPPEQLVSAGKPITVNNQKPPTSLYKKAVLSGLMTAVIIIVLLILLAISR